MTDAEIAAVIQQKLTSALGYQGGLLSSERLKAARYYKGEPFGDEEDGKSRVVARVVAETVDQMIPPLLKPFTASEELASFEPVYKVPRQGETPAAAAKRADTEARQATDLVNYDFFKRNPGFLILHNWIKDGLLQKNGIVKSWWQTKVDRTLETYEGLDDAGLQMLEIDPDITIETHTMYPDPAAEKSLISMFMHQMSGQAPQQGAPPQPTQPAPPPSAPLTLPMLHDVTCRRTRESSYVRIANVPPDEFLIDRRAVSLDEAPFLCHRCKYSISDLKDMFPDVDPAIIDDLPGNDALGDFSAERLERFKDEDAYPYREALAADRSTREIWLAECYIKLDANHDGHAEMLQVFVAGDSSATIIEKNEVDGHPFSAWTPIPMAHKFYGMSIADQTQDLQEINSALFRGALNSMYLSNAPMIGAIDGAVNMDDLMNRRPGGIVRMKDANSLFPIANIKVSDDAFNMLGYLDSVKEARTGVKRFTSTLQADSIQPYGETATGVMSMDQANNDRLECVAKVFAETGIKSLMRRLLELHCKHSAARQIVRMSGAYVAMDPREWSTAMDVTVHTGLGTASNNARLQKLMNLMPIYQTLAASPMVQPQNSYAYVCEILRAAELNPPEKFFSDPGNTPKPTPQPDPKVAAQTQAIQAKTQIAQQAAQAKAQIAQHDAQVGQQQQQAQSQADLAEQQARMQSDITIDRAKLSAEAELARQKAAIDAQLEQLKAQHAMQLEQVRSEHDMAITRLEAAHHAALATNVNKGVS